MEWVETTGRTIEEALDLALDELGVDEEDVDYEVVEEPKGGLFKRAEARIRARVKPVNRDKPQDRRRSARPKREPRKADTRRSEERPRSARQPSKKEENMDEQDDKPTVPVDEQASEGVKFMEGLLDAIGLTGKVKSEINEDDVILISVDGGELGYLIGPRGQTLRACEELLRTNLQRFTGGRSARANLDVAGYREKRKSALEIFAREVAERVAESGSAASLEPMHSSERKIVHDAVAEIAGIRTTSEGEDRARRVVIMPD